MNFNEKYNKQFLSKILLLVVFIPVIIIVLFVFVPIVMSIACILFIVMYITGRKFNRNIFFFKTGKHPFYNTDKKSAPQQNNDYYDAEYISIDNKDK